MATGQEVPTSGSRTAAPREAQRRRTRRELVAAAQRLLQRGVSAPTVDDVAAEADVSRRTVYSYFPTLDQLLLDAAVGLLSGDEVDRALEAAEAAGGSVEDRVTALVRAVLDVATETLPLGRRILRLTVDPPAPDRDAPRRGQRRVEWLERALAPLRGQLDDARFERLVSALSLVVSWEAMVVLRDVRGLDPAAERDVATWAARALVEATLAEVGGGGDPAQRRPRR